MVPHLINGSSSTWFLVGLEFGTVGVWGEGEIEVPGEKPLGAKERTNNKLTHIWRRRRIWTRATLVGGESSHHCATCIFNTKLNLNSFEYLFNNKIFFLSLLQSTDLRLMVVSQNALCFNESRNCTIMKTDDWNMHNQVITLWINPAKSVVLIAGLPRRPCWWSRTKELLSSSSLLFEKSFYCIDHQHCRLVTHCCKQELPINLKIWACASVWEYHPKEDEEIMLN